MPRVLWLLLPPGLLLLGGLLLALALMLARPPWETGGRRAADVLPPAPLVSAAEPLRLGVLGTSLTARYDWPEALAAGLETCLARPVLLTRTARPGATSRWGAGQVAGLLADMAPADPPPADPPADPPGILLVEFVTNDADLRDGLSRAASRAAHRAILATVQAQRPGTRVIFLGMSPASGLRGLLRPGLTAYTADTARLAGATDAGFVDLGPVWRDRIRREGIAPVLPDGLHPDPGTARAIIVPALLRKIPWAPDAVCAPR